jgi:hypothetical protein
MMRRVQGRVAGIRMIGPGQDASRATFRKERYGIVTTVLTGIAQLHDGTME